MPEPTPLEYAPETRGPSHAAGVCGILNAAVGLALLGGSLYLRIQLRWSDQSTRLLLEVSSLPFGTLALTLAILGWRQRRSGLVESTAILSAGIYWGLLCAAVASYGW
jgi:hypothetical protein